MRTYFYRALGKPTIGMGTPFFLMVFLATIWAFAAEEAPNADQKTQSDPMRITADRLESDSEARYADFIGNVTASQGTTVITADRLKVYYQGNPVKSGDDGPSEDSIKKLVSTGNVVIHFGDRVATAEEAIYIVKSRILLLTGPNSSITSGKNTVSGEKITFFRADGRIQVERGRDKQVEAIFYSGGKGLN